MEIKTVKYNENLYFFDGVFTYEKDHLNKIYFDIKNLQKISIITTDEGPFLDDVGLALTFIDTILVLSSEHSCYTKILFDSFSDVLSINYENVIKASTCTENAEFVLWIRNIQSNQT
jgi:hypothetical protein